MENMFAWQEPAVVAILDTNTDVVELLRVSLEQAGLIVFSAHIDDIRRGVMDLTTFLEQHDPQVVVYDIAPPYDAHWRFFQHVRHLPGMQGRSFVITSTNRQRMQEVVGTRETVFELVGRPYDLEEVTRAVKTAVSSRRSAPVHAPHLRPSGPHETATDFASNDRRGRRPGKRHLPPR
jgi:DNA-binding NtrC family response regulator